MELGNHYRRELETLKKELEQISDDKLYSTVNGVSNSCGTLAHHLIGNLNHFIGFHLKGISYTRNRELEFSDRETNKVELIKRVDDLISWLPEFLNAIPDNELNTDYPIEFLGSKRTKGDMIIQMLAHLNYHLGQINYLRRVN